MAERVAAVARQPAFIAGVGGACWVILAALAAWLYGRRRRKKELSHFAGTGGRVSPRGHPHPGIQHPSAPPASPHSLLRLHARWKADGHRGVPARPLVLASFCSRLPSTWQPQVTPSGPPKTPGTPTPSPITPSPLSSQGGRRRGSPVAGGHVAWWQHSRCLGDHRAILQW